APERLLSRSSSTKVAATSLYIRATSTASGRWPNARIISTVGPFKASPPMIGVTATVRSRRSRSPTSWRTGAIEISGLEGPMITRSPLLRADTTSTVGLACFREAFENRESVLLDPIARLVVEDPREPVDDGVHIGTDEQAPELIVVSGVRDDDELVFWRDGLDAGGERSTACASRQDDDLQRNRSSAGGGSTCVPFRVP